MCWLCTRLSWYTVGFLALIRSASFWIIQTMIMAMIFISDYVVSAFGVKKFGGSRSSVVGSTIGLIVGPFIIPVAGLIIGPFLGAVIGELFAEWTAKAKDKKPSVSFGGILKKSVLVGIGSVFGLFSSMVVQVILQLIMIVLFVIWLL